MVVDSVGHKDVSQARPFGSIAVVGIGIADFLADPTQIDTILDTIEAQKATYTFE